MFWIAPSAKDTATETLEKRQWDAADAFCANCGLGNLAAPGIIAADIVADLEATLVQFATNEEDLKE